MHMDNKSKLISAYIRLANKKAYIIKLQSIIKVNIIYTQIAQYLKLSPQQIQIVTKGKILAYTLKSTQINQDDIININNSQLLPQSIIQPKSKHIKKENKHIQQQDINRQIKLQNQQIFHIILLENIYQNTLITINVKILIKTINKQTIITPIVYNLKIQSVDNTMTIKEFIDKYVNKVNLAIENKFIQQQQQQYEQKIQQIEFNQVRQVIGQQVVIVYTGRMLQIGKSFIQQYVQNNSQIVLTFRNQINVQELLQQKKNKKNIMLQQYQEEDKGKQINLSQIIQVDNFKQQQNVFHCGLFQSVQRSFQSTENILSNSSLCDHQKNRDKNMIISKLNQYQKKDKQEKNNQIFQIKTKNNSITQDYKQVFKQEILQENGMPLIYIKNINTFNIDGLKNNYSNVNSNGIDISNYIGTDISINYMPPEVINLLNKQKQTLLTEQQDTNNSNQKQINFNLPSQFYQKPYHANKQQSIQQQQQQFNDDNNYEIDHQYKQIQLLQQFQEDKSNIQNSSIHHHQVKITDNDVLYITEFDINVNMKQKFIDQIANDFHYLLSKDLQEQNDELYDHMISLQNYQV